MGETKLQGFDGEVRIVIPPSIIKENMKYDLFRSFHITDIGYYPKAKNHFCRRAEGSPEHILIHCTDGEGLVTIAERVFKLIPNRYIVLPAGEPHSYQSDNKEPWSIYWMHFHGKQSTDLTHKLLKRITQNNNILPFDHDIKYLFQKFCYLLEQGYGKEILDFISMNLLYYFSAYLYPDKFNLPKQEDMDVVDRSIGFLKENINNKVKVLQIASHVNLSISHFCKLFKSKTGYSPIEYLNHLKIQRACYLLQFSNKRVSSISFELGFDDQYYFSRLFKSHMGVSPTKYRNKVREEE